MGMTDISGKIKTSRPAIPQIYAYSTPEIVRHNGWLKIGYTEQPVDVRIDQQTYTADVIKKLEWHGNATWEDGLGTFRDEPFQAYLEKLGYERMPKKEWFRIGVAESKQGCVPNVGVGPRPFRPDCSA